MSSYLKEAHREQSSDGPGGDAPYGDDARPTPRPRLESEYRPERAADAAAARIDDALDAALSRPTPAPRADDRGVCALAAAAALLAVSFSCLFSWWAIASVFWEFRNPCANATTCVTYVGDVLLFRKLDEFQARPAAEKAP